MIDGELECNLVILLLHVVEDGLYVNETLTNLISDVTRDNLRNIFLEIERGKIKPGTLMETYFLHISILHEGII